jgi:tyrosyl-tRNA synthetase
MQGYDSVAVKADIEIGGFDQLFNLKAGRVIQDFYNMPKQQVITFQMLEGTDGRKMSTSWGNIISIVDDPYTMFGKVMSLRDDLVIKYFLLCTDLSQEDIQDLDRQLQEGVNPKEIKMRLASELVTLYHTEKDATLAKNSWVETFEKGGVPDDITEIHETAGKPIVDIVVERNIVESKTAWRRLIEEGAVKEIANEEVVITDPKITTRNITLKIGKKRFIKIVVE